jgi:hypothetical protein
MAGLMNTGEGIDAVTEVSRIKVVPGESGATARLLLARA